MALGNFPIEAYLQAIQQKEMNRQIAMQNAMGIGQNIGGALEALKKERAKQQLLNALGQPQQLPMQGPLMPESAPMQGPLMPTDQPIPGPTGYVPPGARGMMTPAGQPAMPERPMVQTGEMPQRPMLPNPQADIMGPLQTLYPDIMGKSLQAQVDPLVQSEIFKNYMTGMNKDGSPTYYSPEVMDAAARGDYAAVSRGTGGKGFPAGLAQFASQGLGREGTQERFQETLAEREESRQQRLNNQILQVGIRIDSNPTVKALKEQGIGLTQVTDLLDLVKMGNTVAAASMGTKMAKAMGEVGVLTDKDVKRYVQSGKITQKVADILLTWIKGTPSEATMEEIQQIANVLKENQDNKLQPTFDRHIRMVSENFHIPYEEAAYRLDLPYSGLQTRAGLPKSGMATPQGSTGQPTKPTQTAVQEVIRKTKDGKDAVFNAITKEFIRYK